MKYLTDQFDYVFALATLNSNDVVETVTLETETSFRTSSKIPRLRLGTSKFVDFAKNFQKNFVNTSRIKFF